MFQISNAQHVRFTVHEVLLDHESLSTLRISSGTSLASFWHEARKYPSQGYLHPRARKPILKGSCGLALSETDSIGNEPPRASHVVKYILASPRQITVPPREPAAGWDLCRRYFRGPWRSIRRPAGGVDVRRVVHEREVPAEMTAGAGPGQHARIEMAKQRLIRARIRAWVADAAGSLSKLDPRASCAWHLRPTDAWLHLAIYPRTATLDWAMPDRPGRIRRQADYFAVPFESWRWLASLPAIFGTC